MKKTLVVMVKKPEKGKVKTRLCPPLSQEQAMNLYRNFLLDKIEQVSRVKNVLPALAYMPERAEKFFREIVPENFELIPQNGSDLGERLANVFKEMFSDNFEQIVIIGSDSPTLPTSFIKKSFFLLNKRDVDIVLGPCDDGGYYLIGLKFFISSLFEEISWSTSKVFNETIKRIEISDLRLAPLPVWYDVDSMDDLKRLVKEIFYEKNSVGSIAKNTKEFLREQNILSLIKNYG
ncbi:TIGR04282 family arsenosugar biosynthesis glycosyltransferase [[Eubacterium] cellulosolvens]